MPCTIILYKVFKGEITHQEVSVLSMYCTALKNGGNSKKIRQTRMGLKYIQYLIPVPLQHRGEICFFHTAPYLRRTSPIFFFLHWNFINTEKCTFHPPPLCHKWGRRLEGWPDTAAQARGGPSRVWFLTRWTVHAACPDGPHHLPGSGSDLLLNLHKTLPWATVRYAIRHGLIL